MMIYKIPAIERQAFSDRTMCEKSKYISVEDIGLRFFYQYEDKNLIDRFHKKHFLSKEEMFFLVLAEDAERAIAIFYNNWEGARIGGDKKPEQKALWIDKNKPILELPLCNLMRKNINNQFVCSSPYNLCLIEQKKEQKMLNRKTENCPIFNIYETLKIEKKMNSLYMIKTSWGFNYIPYLRKIDE